MRDALGKGLVLAAATEMLGEQPVQAHEAGSGREVQFPADSMMVKLKPAATKTIDSRAGFAIPIMDAGLGGSVGRQHEALQTITTVFGSPVGRDGHPVRVDSARQKLKG